MGNVTAITRISYGHGIKSLKSSIQYAAYGKNDTAHNSHYGILKHRSFAIKGVNTSDNPKLAYQEMKGVLLHSNFNNHNISVIRDIESFSKNLDWREKSDRKLALKLDEAYVKTSYPHCMSLICGQCDGLKADAPIHFHNIILARRFDNGKSITHNITFKKNAKRMDSILKHFGFKPLHHGKVVKATINRSHGTFYHLHKGDSFIVALSGKINNASKQARNLDDFDRILSKSGIHVELFKMHKVNGHRILKLYDKPAKDGLFKKLSNGKYVRLRKHFSYSFTWNHKKIVVRERKIGTDISRNRLLLNLKKNQLNYLGKKIQKEDPTFHIESVKKPLINKKTSRPIIFGLRTWEIREKKLQKKQHKIMHQSFRGNSREYEINREAKIKVLTDEIAYLKLEAEIARAKNSQNFGFTR